METEPSPATVSDVTFDPGSSPAPDPGQSSASTPAMTYDPGGHVLTDLSSMEDLQAPIKTSSRIKYTCLSVSRRFISLGATTGGLYLFHREKLKCLQLLANKEGAITMVTSAPDDNLVAIATSRGLVVVWELNIERRAKPERLRISTEHRGNTVIALQWDDKSSRLFIGDTTGKVSVANVPSSGKAKGFFKVPTELLLTADSSVVQMDFANERLMVSTLTRCYLCDTVREKFWQVGKKPRDGKFGACFFRTSVGQVPAIYSARPGSRIWEVDFEGNVLNTHQFKKLLAVPPAPVISNRYEPSFALPGATYPLQSLTFSRILMLNNRLLLTWTGEGLFIIDPARVQLVLWTNTFRDIVDIKCYKNDMYVFQSDSRVSRLSLLSVDKCVGKLFSKQMWELCAQVCCHYQLSVIPMKARRAVPVTMVTELRQHLGTMDDTEELLDQLEEILNRIEVNIDSTSSNQSSGRSSVSSIGSVSMLQSGIYQVHSRRGSQESIDSLPEFSWAEEEAVQDGIARPKFDLVPDAPTSTEDGKQNGGISSFIGLQGKLNSSNEVSESELNNVESIKSSDLMQKEQDAIESEGSASDPDKPSMQSADSGNSDGVNISPRSGTKMAAVESEVTGTSDSGTGEEVLEDDIKTGSETMAMVQTTQNAVKYQKVSKEVENAPVDSIHISADIPELKVITHSEDAGVKVQRVVSEELAGGREGTISEEAMVKSQRSADVKGHRLSDRFAHVDLEGEELVVQREGRPIRGKKKKKKKASSAEASRRQQNAFNKRGKDMSYLSLSEGMATESPPADEKSPKRTKSFDATWEKMKDLRSAFQQKMSTLKTGRGLSSDSDTPSNTPEGGATPELSSSPVVGQQLKVMKDKLSVRLQDSRSKLATKSKSLMKAIQENEQIGRIRQTIRRPEAQTGRTEEDDEVFEDDLQGNHDDSISMATESGGGQVDDGKRRIDPPVDVTKLLQATTETSEKLQDPEVLFHPDQARAVLSSWLPHLETALQTLYRTVQEHNAKVRDRSQGKGQKSEVTEDNLAGENEPTDKINIQEGELESEGECMESRSLSKDKMDASTSAEDNDLLEGQDVWDMDVSEDRGWGVEGEQTSEDKLDVKVTTLNGSSPEVDQMTQQVEMETGSPIAVNSPEENSQNDTSKIDLTEGQETGKTQEEVENLEEIILQEGFHVLDPFSLKEENHVEVSELVTLCFQFGVLGEDRTSSRSKDDPASTKVIGQDGLVYDSQDAPDQSESVLQQEAPESDRTCNGDDSLSLIGPDSKKGQLLSRTSQSASLSEEELDRTAAEFVRRHFHFLDVDAVRRTLHYRRGRRTETWDALMDCLKALHSEGAVPDLVARGDVEECLKLLRTREVTEGGAVLACLQGVFSLSPEPVLDTCVQLYPQVHPWEVAHLCQDSPKQFLYYIHRIQASTRHRQSGLLQTLYQDDSVLHQWLSCALTQGAPDKDALMTTEGQPRPGSHLLPWQHSADVDEILSHFSTELESVPKSSVELESVPKSSVELVSVPNSSVELVSVPNSSVELVSVPNSSTERESVVNSSMERNFLLSSCQNAGYWAGYLRLCKGFGHRQEALRTAVLLGDIRLLDPQHSLSVPPKSLEEWAEVLKVMLQLEGQRSAGNSQNAIASQDSMQDRTDLEIPKVIPVPCNDSGGKTLSFKDRTRRSNNVERKEDSDWIPQDCTTRDNSRDWPAVITWEEAGRLLVSSVGPDRGIELLRKLPVPAGRLSEGFYKSCVLAGMICRRQRLLIHSMLEKVDTYLWSKKPTTMAPQLHYAMQQEKLAQEAQRKGTPISIDRSLFVLDPSRREGGVQFLEEPEGHWGISSEDRYCAVCTLLLSDPISTSDPGVTVFPCGHAFHTHCVPQRGCMLCYLATNT